MFLMSHVFLTIKILPFERDFVLDLNQKLKLFKNVVSFYQKLFRIRIRSISFNATLVCLFDVSTKVWLMFGSKFFQFSLLITVLWASQNQQNH
jgi:hypothetical protein